VKDLIKFSILLSTSIILLMYFGNVMMDAPVNWLACVLVFPISFGVLMGFQKLLLSTQKPSGGDESQTQVNPAHLEALYKQAMIVERNAQKANKVFSQQLMYVRKLVTKTRELKPGDDFTSAHEALVTELDVLEQHVERLLIEMQKNVKLGEKLQQSVANLDPEIGVL